MITPFSFLSCYLLIGIALCYIFFQIDGPERLASSNPGLSRQLIVACTCSILLLAWPVVFFMGLLIAAFGSEQE